MELYHIIKTLHLLSAAILLGAGAAIAFFMLRSHFTDNIHEKYFAARNTVLADYLFTLPGIIIQPLSGVWLVLHTGIDWTSHWLLLTYILYIVAGLCWLPVVWLQIQMLKILQACIRNHQAIPEQYAIYFKRWFLLGWPAFSSLLIIFWLMVTRPA